MTEIDVDRADIKGCSLLYDSHDWLMNENTPPCQPTPPRRTSGLSARQNKLQSTNNPTRLPNDRKVEGHENGMVQKYENTKIYAYNCRGCLKYNFGWGKGPPRDGCTTATIKNEGSLTMV